MSNYDAFLNETPSAPPPSKKRKKNGADTLWNVLTVVMLLMTFCVCGVFFTIFQNPQSPLNLLAPSTIVPPPATATLTPIGLPPTWTPTLTLPPTETGTPRPTFTVEPTFTSFVLQTSTPNYTPTITNTPTRTPRPTGAPFKIQVTYYDSTTSYRSDPGCTSMYIAGQALTAQNNPQTGLVIKLGGSLGGKIVSPDMNTQLTGLVQTYGLSGFEFDLKTMPIASSNSLWIQLYDQSGAPLSEQYKLTTYADCKKNLIFVRFQQK